MVVSQLQQQSQLKLGMVCVCIDFYFCWTGCVCSLPYLYGVTTETRTHLCSGFGDSMGVKAALLGGTSIAVVLQHVRFQYWSGCYEASKLLNEYVAGKVFCQSLPLLAVGPGQGTEFMCKCWQHMAACML